jgi:hypothetical protein
MLRERLNCFLGRTGLVTDRLIETLIGDPPARPGALEPAKSGRDRKGPPSELSKGFLSCSGDSMKHSSKETDDVLPFRPLPPAPKVNVGNWLSAVFESCTMLVVEEHLVRESEGRRKVDRLRLERD